MTDKRIIFCDEEIPIVVPKRMMILAGHPDDELISCGGTILKYQELGTEVTVVIATTGLGGYAKKEHKKTILDQRETELQRVAEVLKCTFIELGYSDLIVNRKKISKFH